MSVYSTKFITRDQAIEELSEVWKMPEDMTNEELEDAMFNYFGREGLENSRLENYSIVD